MTMWCGRRIARAAAAAAVVVGGAGMTVTGGSRAAAHAGFSPLQRTATAVSSNWAGYVVAAPAGASPATFTDVVGTWVQPKLVCTKGRSSSSGFWVGLGGASEASEALEQTGTAALCASSGKAVYYAWIELVPAPPVRLRLTVAAGDTLLGAVSYAGGRLVLELENLTRGTSVTRTALPPALDLSSAEWIAEAPSLCSFADACTVARLANFRRVSFSRAAVTGSDHTGTIDDPAWEATPIMLAPAADPQAPAPGAATAVPSPLGADGRSFTVTWSGGAAAG